MGPIEEAVREKFFPELFGGGGDQRRLPEILGRSVKYGGLGITNTRLSVESAYNTSKADNGELVYSLLGGTDLNYVGHRSCVHRASLAARGGRNHVEMLEMARQKDLEEGHS